MPPDPKVYIFHDLRRVEFNTTPEKHRGLSTEMRNITRIVNCMTGSRFSTGDIHRSWTYDGSSRVFMTKISFAIAPIESDLMLSIP